MKLWPLPHPYFLELNGDGGKAKLMCRSETMMAVVNRSPAPISKKG